MLQVSRKFEYGLHAAAYLATRGSGRVVTVKEMADEIGFSQEFLSKAMQSMKKAGITESVQGVKGGYRLARKPSEITIADIGVAIEGKPHMTRCVVKITSCEIFDQCSYRGYMNSLQDRIQGLMSATTIAELLVKSEGEPEGGRDSG
ncbi:RrF2 family transcriptional regulator [Chlorobium sp.]|jgi:Rrf2 family protein|uniref:RrF2 family transcriptional regulator n=1 Tax=Chlorobium sp. TaxID=1095 RepID=UPI003C607903|nr:Rrf2 family transcriptional regulator [Chlorobiaceae bacterium]NTW94490.1 Rrf2 family transcriptional regulator [Chlorobiaceae bacterium]